MLDSKDFSKKSLLPESIFAMLPLSDETLTKKKMLNLKKTFVGSRITVNLTGEPDMTKKGNDLYGRVTRNHLLSGNVAGNESYANLRAKDGSPAPTGAGSWFKVVSAKFPWILKKKKDTDGRRYVRIVRPCAIRVEYIVDNDHVATPGELEIIHTFKVAAGDEHHTYPLEFCENAD